MQCIVQYDRSGLSPSCNPHPALEPDAMSELARSCLNLFCCNPHPALEPDAIVHVTRPVHSCELRLGCAKLHIYDMLKSEHHLLFRLQARRNDLCVHLALYTSSSPPRKSLAKFACSAI